MIVVGCILGVCYGELLASYPQNRLSCACRSQWIIKTIICTYSAIPKLRTWGLLSRAKPKTLKQALSMEQTQKGVAIPCCQMETDAREDRLLAIHHGVQRAICAALVGYTVYPVIPVTSGLEPLGFVRLSNMTSCIQVRNSTSGPLLRGFLVIHSTRHLIKQTRVSASWKTFASRV